MAEPARGQAGLAIEPAATHFEAANYEDTLFHRDLVEAGSDVVAFLWYDRYAKSGTHYTCIAKTRSLIRTSFPQRAPMFQAAPGTLHGFHRLRLSFAAEIGNVPLAAHTDDQLIHTLYIPGRLPGLQTSYHLGGSANHVTPVKQAWFAFVIPTSMRHLDQPA